MKLYELVFVLALIVTTTCSVVMKDSRDIYRKRVYLLEAMYMFDCMRDGTDAVACQTKLYDMYGVAP